jgi:hypothetical protein
MGIIKDHAIRKTLEDGNLRNDPEILELVCDVLDNLDTDIDKLGGIEAHSKETDQSLELLAAAIDRYENEEVLVENGEEDEDEEDEEDNEDDDDLEMIDDDATDEDLEEDEKE